MKLLKDNPLLHVYNKLKKVYELSVINWRNIFEKTVDILIWFMISSKHERS